MQDELKKDYIITKELSNLTSNVALKCGKFLALASAALIATKLTEKLLRVFLFA